MDVIAEAFVSSLARTGAYGLVVAGFVLAIQRRMNGEPWPFFGEGGPGKPWWE